MSVFAWVCRMCGRQAETKDRQPPHCPNCGFPMGRQWDTFAIARVSTVQPHYNHSIGSYVRNSGHLKSEFSRASDQMSERMNQHVDYQPIDPYDLKHNPEAFGVTDEGLDKRAKRLAEHPEEAL